MKYLCLFSTLVLLLLLSCNSKEINQIEYFDNGTIKSVSQGNSELLFHENGVICRIQRYNSENSKETSITFDTSGRLLEYFQLNDNEVIGHSVVFDSIGRIGYVILPEISGNGQMLNQRFDFNSHGILSLQESFFLMISSNAQMNNNGTINLALEFQLVGMKNEECVVVIDSILYDNKKFLIINETYSNFGSTTLCTVEGQKGLNTIIGTVYDLNRRETTTSGRAIHFRKDIVVQSNSR